MGAAFDETGLLHIMLRSVDCMLCRVRLHTSTLAGNGGGGWCAGLNLVNFPVIWGVVSRGVIVLMGNQVS